jgi:hypothetical protein
MHYKRSLGDFALSSAIIFASFWRFQGICQLYAAFETGFCSLKEQLYKACGFPRAKPGSNEKGLSGRVVCYVEVGGFSCFFNPSNKRLFP